MMNTKWILGDFIDWLIDDRLYSAILRSLEQVSLI